MKKRSLIISNRLKELRTKKGFTIYGLAKAIKVTPSHIIGLEKGKWNCSQSLAETLAKELDCNISDIFSIPVNDKALTNS